MKMLVLILCAYQDYIDCLSVCLCIEYGVRMNPSPLILCINDIIIRILCRKIFLFVKLL